MLIMVSKSNAVDGSMVTKDIRKNWENVFSRTILEVLGVSMPLDSVLTCMDFEQTLPVHFVECQ